MNVSEQLLNLIRREISIALTLRGTTRIGLVQSYDPATHSARVAYQPEGVQSGWLPVGTARAGSGAGICFAPNVGDQVLVHFLESDHDSGVIGLRLYSTQDVPPNVPAGQMWIVDDAGSSIKLTNDGNISIEASGDLTVQAAQINLAGNLSLTGTLSATGDVTANGVSLERHVHGGAQPGNGETGPPAG